MSSLALLLDILTKANLATPAIVAIIGAIKSGREAGKTDAEIQEDSMRIALETRAITEEDMGPQP